MAGYDVVVSQSALDEIVSISNRKDLRRVVARIRSLAQDPRPKGCEKLTGSSRYRVRQGNYRVVYKVVDEASTVVVVKVGDRRDVYR